MGFFEGLACRFRVFVTNLDHWMIAEVTGFYDKRAAVENLIKESNNDAGLTAHPSGIWAMNANHFQLSMLAYNLNCWLALFQREQDAKVEAADAVFSGADLAPWRADWDQLWESLSGARIV